MEWLLAKPRSFSNLPAFKDFNGSRMKFWLSKIIYLPKAPFQKQLNKKKVKNTLTQKMFHWNSEKDYENSFWWWAFENFWMPSRAALGLGRHLSATLAPRFFLIENSVLLLTRVPLHTILTQTLNSKSQKISPENFWKTFLFFLEKIRRK